jgi:hypothetical protein
MCVRGIRVARRTCQRFSNEQSNLRSAAHFTDCLFLRNRCRSLYPLSKGAGSTGEHHGHLVIALATNNNSSGVVCWRVLRVAFLLQRRREFISALYTN